MPCNTAYCSVFTTQFFLHLIKHVILFFWLHNIPLYGYSYFIFYIPVVDVDFSILLLLGYTHCSARLSHDSFMKGFSCSV